MKNNEKQKYKNVMRKNKMTTNNRRRGVEKVC
jgi:hypothetical protein